MANLQGTIKQKMFINPWKSESMAFQFSFFVRKKNYLNLNMIQQI